MLKKSCVLTIVLRVFKLAVTAIFATYTKNNHDALDEGLHIGSLSNNFKSGKLSWRSS